LTCRAFLSRSGRVSLVLVVFALVLSVVSVSPVAAERGGYYEAVGQAPFGEASGVVESRQYPGVFWLHPDSGNANALWALRFEGGQLVAFPSGELFRRFDVPSLRNRDWEDIEVDDEGFIWLGDIGNNCQCRGNLAVHKLVEPDPFGGSATVAVEASYPVRWTDGDKDAESLFVLDGAVYVISKEGPRPAVYRLGGLRTDRVNDLVKVAELGATGEVGAIGRPTGADVSRDRSRLAVTTPGHRLFVYETSQTQLRGDDLVRALVGGSPAYEQPYRRDDRWEAVEGVAFIGDTHDVLLASESRRLFHFPGWFYEGHDAPSAQQPAPQPEPAPEPGSEPGSQPGPVVETEARPGLLVPREGAYFGAWVQPQEYTRESSMAAFTDREEQMGRTFDIGHTFYQWGRDFSGWRDPWHRDSGRIPLASWGGGDTREIARGDHDAYVRGWARAVREFGAPLFLRWFWEMDVPLDEYRTHSPEDFVAAWAHIRQIFREEGADNALFVWCPTAWGFASGRAPAWYPGDDDVDWVCANGFNWAPDRPGATWTEFGDIFRAFHQFGAERNKPMMVGAWAALERDAGEKAQWLRNAHATLRDELTGIRAVVYFDTHRQDRSRAYDWRVDTSPESLQAYIDMARDPYFNPRTHTTSSTRLADFTGTGSRETGNWRTHDVTVPADGALTATLDWSDPAADLNLFLYDAAGNLLAAANRDSKPEVLTHTVTAGTYRLGVSYKTGSSPYSLSVDLDSSAPPAQQPPVPESGSDEEDVDPAPDPMPEPEEAPAADPAPEETPAADPAPEETPAADPAPEETPAADPAPEPEEAPAADPAPEPEEALAPPSESPPTGGSGPVTSFELRGAGSRSDVHWHEHDVSVPADGELSVVLEWDDDAADLNLFLFDGEGTLVAWANRDAKPEVLSRTVAAGEYRLAVSFRSGAAAFTLRAELLHRPVPTTANFEFRGAGSRSDVHWHEHDVSVPADGELSVALDWDDDAADLNLFLFDGEGTLVAWANRDAKPEVLSRTVAAGEYRLAVSFRSGAAAYTLRTVVEHAAEPTRTSFELRGAGSRSDVHWHEHDVSVPADGELSVVLEWDDDAADLNLFLFDGEGTLVAWANRDAKPEVLSRTVAAGEYRLAVSFRSGAAAFTLRAELLHRPVPTTANFEFRGAGSRSDVHWHEHDVSVPADGELSVALDWDDDAADLNLFLFDGEGTLVAWANRDAKPEVLSRTVAAGEYRLAVSFRSGAAAYTLRARLQADHDSREVDLAPHSGYMAA
jgi:uncharacterized protein YfaP (DUF2135 family)